MADVDIAGVILAAGRGTRMSPLTRGCPKPLLPVCNRPLLQYQVEAMRDAGISRIFVVVGWLGEMVERTLPDIPGVTIEYVRQEAQLGIAHSVLQIESLIEGPFLLLLGDIFIIPPTYQVMLDMFRAREAGAVLAARFEDNPEMIRRNFTITQGADGQVERVIEKPRQVINRLKGCGVYLFDASVFDAVRRTPRTALRDEYEITDAIQIFIDDGNSVFVWTGIGWDMNLTHPRDLLICNLMQLRQDGRDKVVGEGTRISAGTRIEEAVIGDGVVIEGDPTIRRSLILPGAHVRGASEVVDCVVTPEETLYFGDIELPPGLDG